MEVRTRTHIAEAFRIALYEPVSQSSECKQGGGGPGRTNRVKGLEVVSREMVSVRRWVSLDSASSPLMAFFCSPSLATTTKPALFTNKRRLGQVVPGVFRVKPLSLRDQGPVPNTAERTGRWWAEDRSH